MVYPADSGFCVIGFVRLSSGSSGLCGYDESGEPCARGVPDEKTTDAAESATEDADGLWRTSLPLVCGIESSELSSETSGTSGSALSFRERMLRVMEDSEKGRLLPEGRDWRG